MRLEGVGGSSITARVPSSNITNQVEVGGNRVGKQSETLEKLRLEEVKPVEKKTYSEEEVVEFIEEANKKFVIYDRKFEVSVHEKTQQVMVKVLDSVTDELIREIPPEKMLDIVAGLLEVAGIIVDKKI